MKKNLIPILLLAAGVGFWWWTQKKIEDLRKRIRSYEAGLVPERGNATGWVAVLQDLFSFGMDVYSQFQSGGIFHKAGVSKEKMKEYITENNRDNPDNPFEEEFK
ncbi:MAG: hypothetical protein HOP11_09590 [Saprospiraceae bacterium]|nr:hypothetical protein [Saprospiraceae bacterium]